MQVILILFFSVVLLGTAGCAKAEVKPAEAPKPAPVGPPPLKVCLVSASDEYTSNDSLTLLQKQLERKFNVVCTQAFGTEKDTELKGLETLDEADVMLVFTRRITLIDAQMDRIRKFAASAKGIVGVRTASHAFKKWPEFDHEVLGGNYTGHYGRVAATKLAIVAKAKDHPILAGFKAYEMPSWLYKNTGLATDDELLLTGSIPDHTEPIAWTRVRASGGRVFYTSLGAQGDFEDEGFRQMLIQAIFWTAKRPVEPKPAPAK